MAVQGEWRTSDWGHTWRAEGLRFWVGLGLSWRFGVRHAAQAAEVHSNPPFSAGTTWGHGSVNAHGRARQSGTAKSACEHWTWGLGFSRFRFRVYGLGFGVKGLGFRAAPSLNRAQVFFAAGQLWIS